MANNRKTTNGRQKVKMTYLKNGINVTSKGTPQTVYSEPRRVFKEKYLTPKGKRLLANKEISKKEAWEKYGKKRYTINPNAKPIKVIVHTN